MKLNRLVIFAFLPILLYIFLKGNISFLIFTETVICFSIYEFYNILSPNKKVYNIAGFLISALIPIFIFYNIASPQMIIVTSFFILAMLQVMNNSIKNSTEKLSLTFFGIIYISILFSYILKIKEMNNGGLLVTMIFINIWMCDTMAYIFGISFGKHKFSKISPNKSIEGLIGGFVGVYLVNIFSKEIIVFISNIFKLNVNINTFYISPAFSYKTFLISLIITLFCVFGDLFESKIKREFETKDSGYILLGHGGFLDRFDSALFVIPIMYFIYIFFY